MKSSIYILMSLISTLILYSCQKVISIELPPHEARIVVFCEISEGSTTVDAWVSTTLSILDTSPIARYNSRLIDSMRYSNSDWLENAKLELFENDILIANFRPNSNRRIYQAQLQAPLSGTGNTYRLEVSADGFTKVEASIIFPRKAQITPAEITLDQSTNIDGQLISSLTTSVKDPVDQGDHYILNLRQEYYIRDGNDSSLLVIPLYIASVDSKIEPTPTANILLADREIDGQNYPLEFYFTRTVPLNSANISYSPPKYYLTLSSTSRSKYLFQQSLYAYYQALDNPFAEPVIVYSNIINGAGLFSASIESEIVASP